MDSEHRTRDSEHSSRNSRIEVASDLEKGGDGRSAVAVGRLLMERPTEIECPHPMRFHGPLEEVQPGLAFVPFFANVTVLDTKDGLVLVDCGGVGAKALYKQVRKWRPNTPVHTIIYTHGHLDHVHGVKVFEKEDGRRVRVVAHANVRRRFNRYQLTRGYNGVINMRQFPGGKKPTWPGSWREPDLEYESSLQLDIGGEEIHLYHAIGETDDGTWVWLPERSTICSGDLFIWAFPNCGNPQKVQRYAQGWIEALHAMASKGAAVLLPGHGPPITGPSNVKRALEQTATALELIVGHVVEKMNLGWRLQDVVDSCPPVPSHLLNQPFLRPVYDEPEFVVRNCWRLWGGWWDGNPAHLHPASDEALGTEVATLVGGASVLAARASTLSQCDDKSWEQARQDLALAGHLAEFALKAEPQNPTVRHAYAQVNQARSRHATSLMATNIYEHAARAIDEPVARL